MMLMKAKPNSEVPRKAGFAFTQELRCSQVEDGRVTQPKHRLLTWSSFSLALKKRCQWNAILSAGCRQWSTDWRRQQQRTGTRNTGKALLFAQSVKDSQAFLSFELSSAVAFFTHYSKYSLFAFSLWSCCLFLAIIFPVPLRPDCCLLSTLWAGISSSCFLLPVSLTSSFFSSPGKKF